MPPLWPAPPSILVAPPVGETAASVRPVPVSTLVWVGVVLLVLGLVVHWAVWRALPPRNLAARAPRPSRTGD